MATDDVAMATFLRRLSEWKSAQSNDRHTCDMLDCLESAVSNKTFDLKQASDFVQRRSLLELLGCVVKLPKVKVSSRSAVLVVPAPVLAPVITHASATLTTAAVSVVVAKVIAAPTTSPASVVPVSALAQTRLLPAKVVLKSVGSSVTFPGSGLLVKNRPSVQSGLRAPSTVVLAVSASSSVKFPSTRVIKESIGKFFDSFGNRVWAFMLWVAATWNSVCTRISNMCDAVSEWKDNTWSSVKAGCANLRTVFGQALDFLKEQNNTATLLDKVLFHAALFMLAIIIFFWFECTCVFISTSFASVYQTVGYLASMGVYGVSALWTDYLSHPCLWVGSVFLGPAVNPSMEQDAACVYMNASITSLRLDFETGGSFATSYGKDIINMKDILQDTLSIVAKVNESFRVSLADFAKDLAIVAETTTYDYSVLAQGYALQLATLGQRVADLEQKKHDEKSGVLAEFVQTVSVDNQSHVSIPVEIFKDLLANCVKRDEFLQVTTGLSGELTDLSDNHKTLNESVTVARTLSDTLNGSVVLLKGNITRVETQINDIQKDLDHLLEDFIDLWDGVSTLSADAAMDVIRSFQYWVLVAFAVAILMATSVGDTVVCWFRAETGFKTEEKDCVIDLPGYGPAKVSHVLSTLIIFIIGVVACRAPKDVFVLYSM